MHQSLVVSLALVVAVAFSPLPSAAQGVELNPSHPETYTVQGDDTLWSIAGRFLQEPWRWTELWDANRNVGDPDLIYPGDVLQLYYSGGQPRIRRRGGMRTVRLSPKVRVTPIQEPVPTIPVGAIRPFLSRPYVLDRSQIDAAPYIVAFPDEHIVAGHGDLAYVRGIGGGAGERYDIVRPGEAYKDPDSGDILGYQARFVGDAILERVGDPAKITIAAMELEAGIGDRLLPSRHEKPQTSFLPHSGPRGVQARIISVPNGVSQIGQFNIVVLDVGTDKGVRPGHVFEVFNGGEKVPDNAKYDELRSDWRNQRFWSQETWYDRHRIVGWMPEGEPGPDIPLHARARKQSGSLVLPFERAGTLMVFRAFDRVSFGLIMSATRPIFLLDAVRPPPA